VTRNEAVAQLRDRLEARTNGVALVAVGNGLSPRILAELAAALALVAVDWASECGLPFDD
jgi:hypothetical protein